jgi:hypothetical protein
MCYEGKGEERERERERETARDDMVENACLLGPFLLEHVW